MINITKLYCGGDTGGDALRYGISRTDEAAPESASVRKPIVVWNITRKCNLKCIHCYNDSGQGGDLGELSTAEAKRVIDDLAEFGVSRLLFSGGEPLLREDIFELMEYAVSHSLRVVVSTNGTVIDSAAADALKGIGVSYVGISLDGIGAVNDKFRGVWGAFDRAVAGIRNCMQKGLRVGLRLTLTKHNMAELDSIFDFIEAEGIERACFYHLVPSGRGAQISAQLPSATESRQMIDKIISRTAKMHAEGRKTDILTVDNHADGVYIYLKLLEEDAGRAEQVWRFITWNGGGLNSSGVGIACIDYYGNVHPDQFWGHYTVGNVKEKSFGEIWSDGSDELLGQLRRRKEFLKGRCRLCRFVDACGGAMRVRAELYYGDTWAPDPLCYLTNEEIGLGEDQLETLREKGEIYEVL